MTVEEFSNQFEVLVNSYRRFRDFDPREPMDTIEFNEYEKSLYLTKAQEELVRSLYNGKNVFKESFEQTEELRRYLAGLVVTEELLPTVASNGLPIGMESSSKFFTLPEDLWFITYEAADTENGVCGKTTLSVYPVRQDEYHKIKKNPFRGANDRRVLRLDLADGVVELISKFTIDKYYIRYLKKLKPIILEDLPDGLTIEHYSTTTGCELHEGLHQQILEMAVMMALQSKGIGVSKSAKSSKNK